MAKKLTIVLDDDELYAAVKAEAARLHRPLRVVVAEALQEWLEIQEDRELLPLVAEARADYEKHGGIELGEFLKQLDEETGESRAVYGRRIEAGRSRLTPSARRRQAASDTGVERTR